MKISIISPHHQKTFLLFLLHFLLKTNVDICCEILISSNTYLKYLRHKDQLHVFSILTTTVFQFTEVDFQSSKYSAHMIPAYSMIYNNIGLLQLDLPEPAPSTWRKWEKLVLKAKLTVWHSTSNYMTTKCSGIPRKQQALHLSEGGKLSLLRVQLPRNPPTRVQQKRWPWYSPFQNTWPGKQYVQ